MRHHCSIPLVVFIAGSLLGVLLKTMVLQASPLMTNLDTPLQTVSSAPIAQVIPPQDAPTIGYPCGHSENLMVNTVCLYGAVRQNGQALSGAQVLIAIGDQTKQDITRVHKNEKTPTYAINLGRLNPHYLQTATITATVGSLTVHRQFVLFWDWQTHNQQVDIDLGAVLPSGNGTVFGQVIHYASGGPVSGAQIIAQVMAETGVMTIATATTDMNIEPEPAYKLDLSQLPANTPVTLTALYSGYVVSTAILRTDAPQQVNFVTGRPCDNTNEIPRQGTSRSLPDDSKTLPDEACFWGKVLFKDIPRSDVEVRLTISNVLYIGKTYKISGEKDPRYGIAVPGIAHDISYEGRLITITGVYSGATNSRSFKMNLDVGGNQHVNDIRLADKGPLNPDTNTSEYNTDWVTGIALQDGEIWWGSESAGIIRYNPNTQIFTRYTTLDGLASNGISAVVADQNGALWFSTSSSDSTQYYVSRYYAGNWTHYSGPLGGAFDKDATEIAVDNDGTFWFGGQTGLSHYQPTSNNPSEWQNLGPTGIPRIDSLSGVTGLATDHQDNSIWVAQYDQLIHFWPSQKSSLLLIGREGVPSNITELGVAPDGSLWIGTGINGITHYRFRNCGEFCFHLDPIETFTTGSGIANKLVSAVAFASDNSIWFSTYSGVSHFTPQNPAHLWTTLVTRKMPNSDINVMEASKDGSIWLGASTGLTHYIPDDTSKKDKDQTYTPDNSGLASNEVRAIIVNADSSLWIGTDRGLNYFKLGNTSASNIWKTYTTLDGLVGNNISQIAPDKDGSLWIGTLDSGVGHYTYTREIPPALAKLGTFTSSNTGLFSNRVQAMTIDAKHERVWLGTDKGLSTCSYSSQRCETFTFNDVVFNDVHAIAVDDDGSPWIAGLYGSSARRFNPNNSQLDPAPDAIRNQNIRTITADRDGSLWFGIVNSGLDGSDSGKLIHYTPGSQQPWETLLESPVFAITIGVDGTLWFAPFGQVNHWQVPKQFSDLSLQIVQSQLALQNAPVTYLITVTNNGLRNASNSTLQMTFTNAEFSIVEPNVQVDFSNPTQPIFHLDTIPITGSRQVALKVTANLVPDVKPGAIVGARAVVSTTTAETFLSNNSADVEDTVRNPFKAELHITVNAPPLLIPGRGDIYTVTLGNSGGLTATDILLNIELPTGIQALPGVSLLPSIPPLGPTPRDQPGWQISIPVTVATTTENAPLVTNVKANYITTKDGGRSDSFAQAGVYTARRDVHTLFFIASQRMKGLYVTELMNKLHELAQKEQVKGVVVDVLRDRAVRNTYAIWEQSDTISSTLANGVVQAIKTNLIDKYMDYFPNLRYLVFVGGDNVIPFYRVPDKSNSEWPEHGYGSESVPNDTTVRPALLQDDLLTDDFYAHRAIIDTLAGGKAQALFVPDFASGRLVETPEQIITVIQSFINNGGVLKLNQNPSALIAYDKELTADLGARLCDDLQSKGWSIPADHCTSSTRVASDTLINQMPSLVINAQHSNHASLGELPVENIASLPIGVADQRLFLLFGCHAGLNVPMPPQPTARLTDLDLAEAWLDRGGIVIGSSAYAYVSRHDMAYSEVFAEDLLLQLLNNSTQFLGPALIQTKQKYFTTRQSSGDWDYFDTKVMLPMTLYGLPMWQVQMPQAASLAQPTGSSAAASTIITEITRPSDAQLVTTNVSGEGNYYVFRYQGHDHVLVRKGYPMQPSYSFNLPPSNDGRLAHGVVLRSATYHDEQPFDPVIGDIWVLDDGGPISFIEPAPEFTGWDHTQFYSFGLFKRFRQTVDSLDLASLNVVLGTYNGDSQIERIFDDFTFDVLYSSANITDFTEPVIQTAVGAEDGNSVILRVQATDADSQIANTIGICDDGQKYYSVAMSHSGDSWLGFCKMGIKRFYVQVMDTAGNVANSPWQDQFVKLIPEAYLPNVMRDYRPPLPDLVIDKLLVTQDNAQVVIRNQGEGYVTNDFWVDVYIYVGDPKDHIDPRWIPTGPNQLWPSLSFQGLVWSVTAPDVPLAPGGVITLTLGDAYYTPTLSAFTPTLEVGTIVYAQVDSANKDTNYGAVLETHERNGDRYNNIASSRVVSGVKISVLRPSSTHFPPFTAEHGIQLPARPEIKTRASSSINPKAITDTHTLTIENQMAMTTTIWLPVIEQVRSK